MSDVPEELGPYLVYEQLGSGGMASVHRAEARGIAGFRRPIALKRLHPHIAADEQLLKSFVHEARLASNLHHTNVAQTYDLGKVDDTYFIAMEYVPGPTLTQVIRQCKRTAGTIPLPVVLSIVIQICDALDYAHNLCDDAGKPLNIVHRDVSPSNIIISNTGIVKLIDFGIAKADSSNVHTQTGFIKGKYGYVAPEYTAGRLDARADLFGVGVVAHELLSSRPLFIGRNDFETLTRLREMPIPLPSQWNKEVTPDLDDIIMTALQRDPDQRWQSAAAMRTAVANVTRALGIAVTQQQVFQWVEWAFSQLPQPEDTGLASAIGPLDDPSILIDLGGSDPAPRPSPEPVTRNVPQIDPRLAPAAGARNVEPADPRAAPAAALRDLGRADTRLAPAAGPRDVERAEPRPRDRRRADTRGRDSEPAPSRGRDLERADRASTPTVEVSLADTARAEPHARDFDREAGTRDFDRESRTRDFDRGESRSRDLDRARDFDRSESRTRDFDRGESRSRDLDRAATPTVEVSLVDADRAGAYAEPAAARPLREPAIRSPEPRRRDVEGREPGRRDVEGAGSGREPGRRDVEGREPGRRDVEAAGSGREPGRRDAEGAGPVPRVRPAPGSRPPPVSDTRAAASSELAVGGRPPPTPEARATAGAASGARPPPTPDARAGAPAASGARPPPIPGTRPAPIAPRPSSDDLEQTETAPTSKVELSPRDIERLRAHRPSDALLELLQRDSPPAIPAAAEPAPREVDRAVLRAASHAPSELAQRLSGAAPELAPRGADAGRPAQRPSGTASELAPRGADAGRPAQRPSGAASELAPRGVDTGRPAQRPPDATLELVMRAGAHGDPSGPAESTDPRRKHQSTGVLLVASTGEPPAQAPRASRHIAGWIFAALVVAAATAAVVADLLELTLDL